MFPQQMLLLLVEVPLLWFLLLYKWLLQRVLQLKAHRILLHIILNLQTPLLLSQDRVYLIHLRLALHFLLLRHLQFLLHQQANNQVSLVLARCRTRRRAVILTQREATVAPVSQLLSCILST